MQFSSEELDFISDVFADSSQDCVANESQHQLSVKTDIPQSLKQILVGSKLTLLAEVSHYQLWFPVTLDVDHKGSFSPKLGTPEIIDVQGSERSWRVTTPKNVALIDVFHDQEIEVLSLSATGLTLKLPNNSAKDIDLQSSSLEMSLDGDKPVKLELDLVRHEENVVAAKFKDLQDGRESLRQFLFDSHKTKHSNLYQDIIL